MHTLDMYINENFMQTTIKLNNQIIAPSQRFCSLIDYSFYCIIRKFKPFYGRLTDDDCEGFPL